MRGSKVKQLRKIAKELEYPPRKLRRVYTRNKATPILKLVTKHAAFTPKAIRF